MEFGGSLPVENVQDLAARVNKNVPDQYLRGDTEMGEVLSSESLQIPVVDMSKLNGNQSDHDTELEKLHLACKDWGFFQLINHGVPEEVIQQVKIDIEEFFKLPLDDKKAYAQLPNTLEGYGQAFVLSEDQKLDWGDMLLLFSQPPSRRNMRFWPKKPASFSATLDMYSSEFVKLSICLLSFMAKNLKLDPSKLVRMFEGGIQGFRMNYYPKCPQARNVIGLSPHSDSSGLIILLQVNDVDGLQIRKDNKWVAIKPLPGAFIVNIGDTIEIITNGEYKSIEHRAVVNPEKERLSIAAFHSPKLEATVGPLADFTMEKAAHYKTMSHEDYIRLLTATKLDGKNRLDHIRL
jgi:isopenicillin N synthase-like dioxygenase